jgi:hypothetical protein
MWPEAASSRDRAGHFAYRVRVKCTMSTELTTDQIKTYLFERGYEDDHNPCIAMLFGASAQTRVSTESLVDWLFESTEWLTVLYVT